MGGPERPEGPERWDAHAHVIGDPARFPLSPARGYDPPPAPLEAYLALLDRLRIRRGLLVQPSVYGFDNACLLDALDRADGRLLGVAVPPPDATPEDLRALHARGVRGVRCNLLNPGGLDPAVVAGWQPVLESLGWHVAVQLSVEAPGWEELLDRFRIPVVVDHMGGPSPGHADPHDPGNPAAPALRRLVEQVAAGRCFVKLSAPYRLSAREAPWPDVTPLARALLAANPDACAWGSDWPHTDTEATVGVDDLQKSLKDWCPHAGREALLAGAGRLVNPGGGPS